MAALTTAARLAETLAALRLVDGHCHQLLAGPVDATDFEQHCTEADHAHPKGVSRLDGPVGLAVRRWCAPELDLPPGAPIDGYLDRRAQLGEDEVRRRLLRASRLSQLLVDTGLDSTTLAPPDALRAAAGAMVREVVRVERVAEQLASTGVSASEFAPAYTGALAAATTDAVGTKSVLAYRHGFSINPVRPSPAEVRAAAGEWLARPGPPRLDHPVLLRFVLWSAIDRALPVQLHAGFGDRDVQLAGADPVLLQPFIEAAEPTGVPLILLHCYPYQRQAGWLAQVYPAVHVDVGLTVAQVGARAGAVLAEFFELTPFGKLLFSTDGYALPELYLVGAAQFRHGLAAIFGEWVDDGAMALEDAERVAKLIGSENARRLYRLPADVS